MMKIKTDITINITALKGITSRKTPMFRLRSIILAALVVLLSFGFIASPATAATKTTITIKSLGGNCPNQDFPIVGTVSGKSAGATVSLQRFYSGKWHTVKKVKVTSNKKYTVNQRISAPNPGSVKKTKYRAIVAKTKYIKAATSKTTVITTYSSCGGV